VGRPWVGGVETGCAGKFNPNAKLGMKMKTRTKIITAFLCLVINISILRVRMINHSKIHILIFLAFLAVPLFFAGASVQDDIDAKNRLLEEYQRQMEEYIQEAEKAGTQSKTLQNEIARLNTQIKQVQLEIKSLDVSIKKTDLEIGVTETKIGDAETEIGTHKNALAQYIKIVNEKDDIMIITKNGSLIRTNVSEISEVGRNTKGVKIMKLDSGDKVINITKIISEEVVKTDFTLGAYS